MKQLTITALVLLAAAAVCMGSLGAQEQGTRPRNLQVLPHDISEDALSEIMLENLSGLGLPRRSARGCLHCHVGSPEVHWNDWDYAADDKPAKDKARVMMAMVREINEGYLSRLESRGTPAVKVTCYTCHAGRINPMPLDDLLLSQYETGGVAALEQAYRDARTRYYAADAYDFRVGTLIGVANRLAGLDQLDDAATVLTLNVEFHDEPAAHAGLVALRLLQALRSSGIDGMVARYAELKTEHPAEALGPQTLGGLGWQLVRGDDEAAGLRLFELSYADHPDTFTATENMAYGFALSGELDRGLELARRWVREHPDHEAGRGLVTALERQLED